MTAREATVQCEVLNWLARLPFLAAEDLALLTGQPITDVATVLREMDRSGQADWIAPSSPEMDSTRLYVLTEPARRWASGQLQGPDADRVLELPLAWSEVIHRLTHLEATVGLNVFAANLVSSVRRDAGIEVQGLRALPVRRPREAWWPAGTQGYGCLALPGGFAPFFVALDRAGVPAVHRRALVAGWYAFRESRQSWGRDDIPPILVICAQPEQEDDWAQAVLASAGRRGVAPLRVLLTYCSSGFVDDPGGPVWRTADGLARATMKERLAWRPEIPVEPAVLKLDGLPMALDVNRQAPPRLQQWALALAGDHGGRGRDTSATTERLAALSLMTSSEQKRLLECAGRHPLLAEAELAAVLGLPAIYTRRVIEKSFGQGLVNVAAPPDGTTGVAGPRYSLTETGLRLLAARDGVSLRRYAQHGPLAAALPGAQGGRLQTLVRQFEHTIGANSFFVSCLTRSPGKDPKLVSWQSAFEAATRFECGGVRRWLRPDGAGDIEHNRAMQPFFLEWDRGTERIAVLLEKLDRYAAYYRTRTPSRMPFTRLLIVTPSPHREEVVWKAVATVFVSEARQGCVLTTVASLIEQWGPYAPIWRAHTSARRGSWPE
ncbi:MAG: hypothetical protein C0506_12115 [Anaerolinea sp.]|nr:hypothetical protein [Anaerolinea sp.]